MNILFAENSKRNVVKLKQETVKDLALQEIVDNIANGESERLIIRDIFTKIPTDLEDIRFMIIIPSPAYCLSGNR